MNFALPRNLYFEILRSTATTLMRGQMVATTLLVALQSQWSQATSGWPGGFQLVQRSAIVLEKISEAPHSSVDSKHALLCRHRQWSSRACLTTEAVQRDQFARAIKRSARDVQYWNMHLGCACMPREIAILTDLLTQRETTMETIVTMTPLLTGAAEYSLIYMLGGGGLFGAIVIYFIAKALHR